MAVTPNLIADPTPVVYGQALIHTADGKTYVVTGNLGQFIYKQLPNGDFAGCMIIENAVGLPVSTDDTIFKDGFDKTIDICYPE